MDAALSMFKLAAACTTNNGFLPGLYDGITCTNGAPQLNSVQDALVIVGNGVRIAMAMSGALAVIFVIVGGIYYVISAGDPSRIKRGKDIIMYAIVGMVISLIAYAVVTFMVKGF